MGTQSLDLDCKDSSSAPDYDYNAPTFTCLTDGGEVNRQVIYSPDLAKRTCSVAAFSQNDQGCKLL